MFKHILLPSDGSVSAEAALKASLLFAKEIGARVTGLHVVQEFQVFTYDTAMLEDTREQFIKDSALRARKILAVIENEARELGVECETMQIVSNQPYEAIIAAAHSCACDLVAMASHGRRGLQGLLLGSETQKVLTHCTIPVLVYR
ncbi:MAG: universal stress protein [Pseudomonadota bacterium]